MAESLAVLLGGVHAASITRANGLLRLEYVPDYTSRPDPTPISLSMPLAQTAYSDTHARPRIANFLQGLLPDDAETLRAWARRYNSSTAPFQLLATPVGHDCAGAIAFCPESERGSLESRSGSVEWLDGENVATILRELRRDPAAAVMRNFTGQFSLAGAQAKVALRYDAELDRWGRPNGSEPTTHIFKPAAAGWKDQDINEHLCLAAAAKAGLDVARSEIRRFDSETAIVVARFDRVTRGSSVVRVHQEDLCQAFGLGPDQKYENQGGPSARAIAELLRKVMPSRTASDAIAAFADGLLWNWLVMGTDAHAKNYSVLLLGDAVRFAPLYDISSMLPYLNTRHPQSQEVIHIRDIGYAMKLGGDYDVYPLRDRWDRVGVDLGMSPETLHERARSLAVALPDAFSDSAADPVISGEHSKVAAQLVDRASARSAECVKVLDQGRRSN